jgi:hypothetical protein
MPHLLFLALLALLALPLAAGQPWLRHTIDASSKGADGVRLADVNADGLMDIATGWEEGGIVRAYLHPGRGHETKPWPAVTVGKVKSAEDAVFADLDADGAVDVVSSCEGSTRTMFIHWAPTKSSDYLDPDRWTTEAIPATEKKQSWMYAHPFDVDARHGVDLITGSKGKEAAVGWLQAPPDPHQLPDWKWHRLQDAGWIMSLIATDMDADGDPDILVSDRRGPNQGVYWLEFPGHQAAAAGKPWKRHDIGRANPEILFIAQGDLDRDGRTDVVGCEKKSVLWFRNTPDGWTKHVIPLPPGVGGGKSAAIGDIDADGRNDLVFACEGAKGDLSGTRWLSHKGSPANDPWTSHEVAGSPGLKYDRLVLHDIDGDGDPDILNCEERDQLGVFWYENTLNGP